jgi:hypothetical protein
MQLELSEAERDALARFLRTAIDGDRYPLSPARAAQGDFGEARSEAPGAADFTDVSAEPGDGPKAALGSRALAVGALCSRVMLTPTPTPTRRWSAEITMPTLRLRFCARRAFCS